MSWANANSWYSIVRKEKDHTPFAFMKKNGQIYRHKVEKEEEASGEIANIAHIVLEKVHNKNIDISNFYPIFQELISISVYNRSGHVEYNIMKVIMRLPSISTLKSYINEHEQKSGWQDKIAYQILSNLSIHNIWGYGRIGLLWSQRENCYVGYLDFEDEMHKYHTFTLNCQQEIESIFKNNNLVFNEQKSHNLNTIIFELATKLECIGIRTIGSVCDGADENRTHIKRDDWYFISDPTHVFKKLRNNLSKSHTATKLTKRHIWSKIRIDLTEQTLSKEVEDALESIDELKYISDKTRDFIKYSRKYRQIMHSKLIFRSLDDPRFTTLKKIRNWFVYGAMIQSKRISQDMLEGFFGTIRELGGDSSTQTLKSYGYAVNKYQVTALVPSEIKQLAKISTLSCKVFKNLFADKVVMEEIEIPCTTYDDNVKQENLNILCVQNQQYNLLENIFYLKSIDKMLQYCFHLEVYLNNYRCSGVWYQDFLEATHLNGTSTQRLVAFFTFPKYNINLEPAEASKFVYIVGWIIYKLIKSNTMKSHPKFEAMSAHLKVLSSEQIVYEWDVRIQTTNITPGLNQLRVWAQLENVEEEFSKIFLVSDLQWLLWAFEDNSKKR
ncbi:1615_t:CDS:10 [Diversispora eburnea]|uniref:1615_t:CDS:1 n=1 Tax=Diversispora eburnea TaxID=1213867 RepID=A0A9N8ZGT6_9GLOM|nr:1615_t:CDS:10 [Diversispora eburnea]